MEDDRMEVEIDFPPDLFIALALMAHEDDITLNQLCNKALKEFVDSHPDNTESK